MLTVTTPPSMNDADHPEAETWEITNTESLVLYKPGDNGGDEISVAEYARGSWCSVTRTPPLIS